MSTPSRLASIMAHVDSGNSWQAKAKAKRESVLGLIPDEWRIPDPVPAVEEQRNVTGPYIQQFLSQREVEITETDAVGIVQHTSSGQWKAEEVARAFAHRAALAHQLVNCLHEIFFDAGIEDAKKLDTYYSQHQKPVGPLHGLPISLKDQFHVKGVETHMGYVGWIDTFEGQTGTGKERVFESEMVEELRDSGAVLYCKTSVPHSLMRGETINNIVGYTSNPINRYLASGGSSGGEGALIAAKGSPLGFGTDIGGSIRIPASFCGLYGLKPSSGRLPYEGMANSMDGQNSVVSTVGPLAHSVSSLRLAVKALLARQPWDHDSLVNNMPWRKDLEDEVETRKHKGGLVFGYFRHDGVVRPWPPIQRAMSDVIERLQKAGHKVIEWDASSTIRGSTLIARTWNYDGGRDIHEAFKLSGEEMSKDLMYKDVETAPGPEYSATDISKNNVAIRAFRKEFMERWNATKEVTGTGRPIDGIIAPTSPSPSSEPLLFRYYNFTTWVNLLDYPSCAIPVTKVDQARDVVPSDLKALSEIDAELLKEYKPEIFHGAPVAVQVVGRRLQEEKVLALAEYIGNLLQD